MAKYKFFKKIGLRQFLDIKIKNQMRKPNHGWDPLLQNWGFKWARYIQRLDQANPYAKKRYFLKF